MRPKVFINKENFNEVFSNTTGILEFPNPYDYTGEEFEQLKKRADWYLVASVTPIWKSYNDDVLQYEDGSVFETENNKNITKENA